MPGGVDTNSMPAEAGFTRIPNEILEALCRTRIPGEARMILDVIIRKTFGFGKKQDAIPLSQFELATGLTRNNICASINQLTEHRLISLQKETGSITRYCINASFSQWLPVSKKRRLEKETSLKREFASLQKETLKKKTSKEIKKPSCPDKKFLDDVIRLSALLADLILANNPKHTGLANGKREATIRSWCDPIDKLIRLDGQTAADIERIIRWSQGDSFWCSNILSGSTLRKQYNKLAAKALRTGFVPAAGPVVGDQAEGGGWDEETLSFCSRSSNQTQEVLS